MTTQQLQAEGHLATSQQPIVDGLIVAVPSSVQPIEPPPPKRRTPARLQACFLRHFSRTGSVVEAAARTGITPRTVRRWRAGKWSFKKRYDAAIAERLDILEDRAMQRAFSIDRRTVFHRGQPVAVAERFNDAMLMRVLVRFDRVRERELARPHRPEFPQDLDLTKLSGMELAELAGIKVPPGMSPSDALEAAYRALVGEVENRMSRLSPSSGQDNKPGSGQ